MQTPSDPMPVLLIGSGRGSLTLGPSDELARAGEGVVYKMRGHPDTVAKIWHPTCQTSERAQKLRVMLLAPPDDPTLETGHRSICWPSDSLLENGKEVGFLMPRFANGMTELTDIYHPGARQKTCSWMTFRHLVTVARNIASVFEALHLKGYVIGDINFKNWVVAHNCQVSVIDTDSFQVRDALGNFHYCIVGTPGYIAPELRGKDFSRNIIRTTHQDTFGLGVLLFQLLMHGNHPTRGVLPDSYGKEEQQKIDAGAFPWGKKRPMDQNPLPLLAPLYDALTPELQRLFEQCFREGYRDPEARPSASQWRHTLDLAYKSLVTCRVNKQHCYFSHRSSCVWCERERNIRNSPPATQQKVGLQQRISGSMYPAPTIAASRPSPSHHSFTSAYQNAVRKYGAAVGLSAGVLLGLAVGFIPCWIVAYIVGFFDGIEVGYQWYFVLWAMSSVLGIFATWGWAHDFVSNPAQNPSPVIANGLAVSLVCIALSSVFIFHYIGEYRIDAHVNFGKASIGQYSKNNFVPMTFFMVPAKVEIVDNYANARGIEHAVISLWKGNRRVTTCSQGILLRSTTSTIQCGFDVDTEGTYTFRVEVDGMVFGKYPFTVGSYKQLSGGWEGEWQNSGILLNPLATNTAKFRLKLKKSGSILSGTYYERGGSANINGSVNGKQISFGYEYSGGSKREFTGTMNATGKISGKWSQENGSGTWKMVRKNSSLRKLPRQVYRR